jgi:hypothetical protein
VVNHQEINQRKKNHKIPTLKECDNNYITKAEALISLFEVVIEPWWLRGLIERKNRRS